MALTDLTPNEIERLQVIEGLAWEALARLNENDALAATATLLNGLDRSIGFDHHGQRVVLRRFRPGPVGWEVVSPELANGTEGDDVEYVGPFTLEQALDIAACHFSHGPAE